MPNHEWAANFEVEPDARKRQVCAVNSDWWVKPSANFMIRSVVPGTMSSTSGAINDSPARQQSQEISPRTFIHSGFDSFGMKTEHTYTIFAFHAEFLLDIAGCADQSRFRCAVSRTETTVTTPAREGTLIMTPLLFLRIELRTGNVTVIGPRTLTVISFHHACGGVYAKGPSRLAPALFTRIVMGPKVSSTLKLLSTTEFVALPF